MNVQILLRVLGTQNDTKVDESWVQKSNSYEFVTKLIEDKFSHSKTQGLSLEIQEVRMKGSDSAPKCCKRHGSKVKWKLSSLPPGVPKHQGRTPGTHARFETTGIPQSRFGTTGIPWQLCIFSPLGNKVGKLTGANSPERC